VFKVSAAIGARGKVARECDIQTSQGARQRVFALQQAPHAVTAAFPASKEPPYVP